MKLIKKFKNKECLERKKEKRKTKILKFLKRGRGLEQEFCMADFTVTKL